MSTFLNYLTLSPALPATLAKALNVPKEALTPEMLSQYTVTDLEKLNGIATNRIDHIRLAMAVYGYTLANDKLLPGIVEQILAYYRQCAGCGYPRFSAVTEHTVGNQTHYYTEVSYCQGTEVLLKIRIFIPGTRGAGAGEMHVISDLPRLPDGFEKYRTVIQEQVAIMLLHRDCFEYWDGVVPQHLVQLPAAERLVANNRGTTNAIIQYFLSLTEAIELNHWARQQHQKRGNDPFNGGTAMVAGGVSHVGALLMAQLAPNPEWQFFMLAPGRTYGYPVLYNHSTPTRLAWFHRYRAALLKLTEPDTNELPEEPDTVPHFLDTAFGDADRRALVSGDVFDLVGITAISRTTDDYSALETTLPVESYVCGQYLHLSLEYRINSNYIPSRSPGALDVPVTWRPPEKAPTDTEADLEDVVSGGREADSAAIGGAMALLAHTCPEIRGMTASHVLVAVQYIANLKGFYAAQRIDFCVDMFIFPKVGLRLEHHHKPFLKK